MTPHPESESRLRAALDSLDARTSVISVRLTFPRPQEIKFSSAVAFRGLLGNILRNHDPELESMIFKPDPDGFRPPPFAVRLVRGRSPLPESDAAEFLIAVLADAPGIPARLSDLIRDRFPGSPFGESRILAVRTARRQLTPPPFADAGPEELFRVSLDFITPVRIKRHGIIVDPLSFSPAFVVSALLEKINAFSLAYASSEPVPAADFIARTALLPLIRKDIRFQTQQRTSGNSGCLIHLGGCVGSISFGCCTSDLIRIFHWGSRFGVGRHTSAGSGMFLFAAERSS